MTDATLRLPILRTDVYEQARKARDARFDGVFFIGITTTRIYCRVVCPSRAAIPTHRRFFNTAAAAERAGFRPCLRCRPELAPGRPWVGAVQHLAALAAHRIDAGALNGRSVADLARALGISERHLRRALDRELGVSPVELAQTHRLLLAKRLLADTRLSITEIAFASGFQSVRRFNSAFRDRYRMPPTAVRRLAGASGSRRRGGVSEADARVRLTLGYRAPLAWNALLETLARDVTPGVETIAEGRYARTVRMGPHRGLVLVSCATPDAHAGIARPQLVVEISPSLVPALMPLLAGLRQLFDLDAEPAVIDAHLSQGGLTDQVGARPGVRVPGALDGFEVALRVLLAAGTERTAAERAHRLVRTLGEPLGSELPGLTHLFPDASRIAEAGAARLAEAGIPPRRAGAALTLARVVAAGDLRLEPGEDVVATHRQLSALEGVDDRLATLILMRALRWPDAFPSSDRTLLSASGAGDQDALLASAERWRPWRAYAAVHLWLGAPR